MIFVNIKNYILQFKSDYSNSSFGSSYFNLYSSPKPALIGTSVVRCTSGYKWTPYLSSGIRTVN